MKKQNIQDKKLNSNINSKTQKDKSLPWWVELLFVQIGLPDKLLVKILKTKKSFKDKFSNDKSTFFIFLLFIASLAYLYPIVKQSQNKIDCEKNARRYIIDNKNFINIDKKRLNMLSTNFCNGGQELYKFKDSNI